MRQGLQDRAYTAACLLVGCGRRILLRRACGRLSPEADASYASEQTRFDLDSITKPLVTATLALRALEAGKLCMKDSLGTFLNAPEDKQDITIEQLLCHTSGLDPALSLPQAAGTPQNAAQAILDAPLLCRPGTEVHYGSSGYILLGQLLECLYDLPLNELAIQEIFWPLGMQHTGYLPSGGHIAATERQPDGRYLQGIAHDETARFLGGVSGHAGVFGTMDDLALWLQMIAAHGELPDGSQYLSRASIRLMQKQLAPGRGLGFAFPAGDGFTGDLFPETTIGHTGFTGCSAALEPETGVYVVFLTNRVCPGSDHPAIHRIRRLLHNAVYSAV